MPLIRILRNDFSVNATITSSNEEADAKASAMLDYRHSERWKTTSLTAMQATIDAGSSLPWDSLFLGYTNATSSATLRVTSDDNSGVLFSSPTHDSGAFTLRLPASREFISWHAFYEAGSTQTFRYVGIEIVDATNPDGFITAGICYVGNLFTPSIEASLETSRGYVDPSIQVRMANGEAVVRRRARKQEQRLKWEFQNEADAGFFDDLAATYGESTPIVIKREPTTSTFEHNLITYGYASLRQGSTIGDQNADDLYEVEMSITEV